MRNLTWAALLLLPGTGAGWSPRQATEAERTERFDRDPGWDGHNNRSRTPEPRTIRQDFGYSRTSHAGGAAGEVGGSITPSAEPSYYGKKIPAAGLDDVLTASGTMAIDPEGKPGGNTLIGFFNAETVNEWRTPNSILLRINGRGDGFHAHLEYATARWRAGADFFSAPAEANGRRSARLLLGGPKAHSWSLAYDPRAHDGAGAITAVLDGETLVLKLDPGHKADGATFTRFGLLNVMKSADSPGSIWLDDVTVQGAKETFDADPGWEGRDNRRTYTTENIRPRFSFGYSPTRHAGGRAAGEMGGLVFRGDERYPERMAYYGDRLDALTLEKPLKASGRVCLRRGVTDSTVLLGFFHSADSMKVSQAQASGIPENFLGIALEGPSREGFLFYPTYGVDRDGTGASAVGAQPPRIPPDGKSHEWTLEYSAAGRGRIVVTLDGRSVGLDLPAAHREIGARFDRFGLVTTHIDGNAQDVYFDDLTYTARQP